MSTLNGIFLRIKRNICTSFYTYMTGVFIYMYEHNYYNKRKPEV